MVANVFCGADLYVHCCNNLLSLIIRATLTNFKPVKFSLVLECSTSVWCISGIVAMWCLRMCSKNIDLPLMIMSSSGKIGCIDPSYVKHV